MRILASMAIGLWIAAAAAAAENVPGPACCGRPEVVCGSPNCCAHCGCNCCCEKTCHLVCETKKITKVVWEVKCEEFCPLLPGCKCQSGQCCGQSPGPESAGCQGCQQCGKCCKSCDPCAVEREKCYVTPKCGCTRCKKTLIKKEVVCTVPSYRCVVEYCCPACMGSPAPEGKPVPAPAPGPNPTPAPTAPLPTPPTPKTAEILSTPLVFFGS